MRRLSLKSREFRFANRLFWNSSTLGMFFQDYMATCLPSTQGIENIHKESESPFNLVSCRLNLSGTFMLRATQAGGGTNSDLHHHHP